MMAATPSSLHEQPLRRLVTRPQAMASGVSGLTDMVGCWDLEFLQFGAPAADGGSLEVCIGVM